MKQPSTKMGKRYEQTIHQRRYMDGKYSQEKMPHVISH